MHTIPNVIERLRRLVAEPSMSSPDPNFDQSNLGVIELLAQWLEELNFRVEILPLPDQPHKANLIANLGAGDGGLVLAGHTDTVPFDAGRWRHDPFKLNQADGRLYGLGSCDMKGFFAIALEAVANLKATQLTQPLTIVATADEESTMAGARALLALKRPRARHALIGEPTGLRPIRMHKGMMMECLRLRGRSGHSSDPTLGNSALEGMQALMAELLKWRAELQQRFNNRHFALPQPTLNLGRISGGDSPNRICGCCELHIDLRPLPGMELDELRHILQAHLEPVAAARGLELEMEQLFPGVAAFETPENAPIVRAAESFTGHAAGAVNFATEAPFLQQLNMETLILGPGAIDQAHQPDEYLALNNIDPAVKLLRHMISRFCRSS